MSNCDFVLSARMYDNNNNFYTASQSVSQSVVTSNYVLTTYQALPELREFSRGPAIWRLEMTGIIMELLLKMASFDQKCKICIF